MTDLAPLIAEIQARLVDRAAEYPKRSEGWVRLVQAIDALADALATEAAQTAVDPDDVSIREAFALRDHAIIIGGAMKSGTTLLGQLLDSHPRLFVLPGDAFMRERLVLHPSDDRSTLRYWLGRAIHPAAKPPYWFLGPAPEVLRRFASLIRFFVRERRSDDFTAGLLATYICRREFHGIPPASFWVEKTPENELFLRRLFRFAPQAKFLNTVRDPIINIDSLLRMNRLRGKPAPVDSLAFIFRRLLYAAGRNRRAYPDRYLVTRYEDVIAEGGAELRRIASFLGIELTESMLVPTEGGRTTASNSMHDDRIVHGSVLRDPGSRDKTTFSPAERRLLAAVLSDVAGAFGYDVSFEDLRFPTLERIKAQARRITRSAVRRLRPSTS